MCCIVKDKSISQDSQHEDTRKDKVQRENKGNEENLGGGNRFLFSYKSSRWALGCSSLFRGVKRPGRDVDHSPPASAEVKHDWSYTSTPCICLRDVDRGTSPLQKKLNRF